MRLALCLMTIYLSVRVATAADADWPQFRGPNGSGVAPSAHPPQKFGQDENMLWKTEIPPGLSSPIVTERRIFITAKSDDQLITLAYEAATGRELWRRAAPAEMIEKTHEFSSPAAATPCTDGEQVFAYFNSFGALAYDLDGKQVWQRKLPTVATRYGSASSPVVIDRRLILQRDGGSANSQIMALDPATGKTLWEIPRTPAGGPTQLRWSGSTAA